MKVSPPILPAQLADYAASGLADGQRLEGVSIKATALSGLTAKRVDVDSCRFEDAEISTCQLKKANIIDAEFENCLLFGTNLDGSGLQRVAVRKGMQSGLVLSDSTLKDVVFEDARLNLSNFRISKLKRVMFVNCDLTEADFYGAELSSVVFQGCDLARAEFAGCKMSDVDMRGSEISSIKGVAGLKGAKIDNGQLISLSRAMAAELGLVEEE